ncbi:hypothetical protein C0Q70_13396 [Pomacea canaliculata]|uniref:MAM domain-containing protein n=1 Tax=Pomacea canaliculata TaxID=400727 RepID=A0A2T7NX41_POMCA|nr:hypothetical protein C0Q70_13396 [Pomacea canaliculata]
MSRQRETEKLPEVCNSGAKDWKDCLDSCEHVPVVFLCQGHHYFFTVTSDREKRTGKYVVAEHSRDDGAIRVLMSPCQAAGRNCTVHFDLLMQNSSLQTVLTTFCSACGLETMGGHLVQDSVNGSTSGWVPYTVHLEEVHSAFVLNFVANVGESGSLVALDNIVMEKCAIDPQEKVCNDDQYQCPDTSHCIDRDRLCDLQPDCWCGQDEEDDVCAYLLMIYNADYFLKALQVHHMVIKALVVAPEARRALCHHQTYSSHNEAAVVFLLLQRDKEKTMQSLSISYV